MLQNGNNAFFYFLVRKGLLNDDDVGGPWVTVFQKIWPGAGFKTSEFVNENLGGGGLRSSKHPASLLLVSALLYVANDLYDV